VMIRMPLLTMHNRPASFGHSDDYRMEDRRQDDLQRGVDSDRYESN
jgi:hypothetical protein